MDGKFPRVNAGEFLVSTNRGIMTDETIGHVLEVLIANDPNSILSIPKDSVEVAFEGFVGDKHSGLTKLSDGRTKFYTRGTTIRNSRQISIISKEELDVIASDLAIERLLPDWLGANLLLAGIPNLTGLKPNTRLFFDSGAVLLITADNLPCETMAKEICSHFSERHDLAGKIVQSAMNKRGVVAVVELPGQIKKGDNVRVVYTQR
jgi:hypothetical protein